MILSHEQSLRLDVLPDLGAAVSMIATPDLQRSASAFRIGRSALTVRNAVSSLSGHSTRREADRSPHA